MRNFGVRILFIVGVATTVAFAADQAPKVKAVPVKLSGSIDGAELFREHCAVCHGIDAKGNGPAAAALKKHPADLTQISRKNGGKFPELAVLGKIRGGEIMEHG